MPVKLLCGNDEYSISTELNKIKKSVLDEEYTNLNHKRLDENLPKQIDLDDICKLIDNVPMLMFGNLFVEIRTTSLFTRGKTENEKLLDKLINLLKNLSDNICVVFVCIFPKEDDKKKIDSAKKIVKAIKEIGEIKEFNCFKFFETDKVVSWIMNCAKSKKLILSFENATLLQSNVGSDLRTLDTELEKLKTYILPSNEITKEDIIKLSQQNEDSFIILDLWLKDDKQKMFEELDRLIQKEAPQKVIALFQTTIKRWLRIKLEAQYSNADEIARIIGAHPFFVKNEITKLRNTSKEKLLQLRKDLTKAEFQMKSGLLEPATALETALVK